MSDLKVRPPSSDTDLAEMGCNQPAAGGRVATLHPGIEEKPPTLKKTSVGHPAGDPQKEKADRGRAEARPYNGQVRRAAPALQG
jgi:hypothetical protein